MTGQIIITLVLLLCAVIISAIVFEAHETLLKVLVLIAFSLILALIGVGIAGTWGYL